MSDKLVADRRDRVAAVAFDYEAQPKSAVGPCNLCAAETWTIISHSDRYGFPAPSMSCDSCSLTVLNPRMTSNAYADFYASTYRPLVSAYHGRRIDAQTVKDEQPTYAQQVARVVRGLNADFSSWRSFLDIGGSTGVVAAHFARELGVIPTVIDPAPDEVAEAERLGIETITGFFEEWQPRERSFDVVGMFQTADHLLDVALTLAKVREVMSDEGLFIVDIVDFRAAYLRSWSVEEATKVDHPFALTPATFEAYLRRTGFGVIRRSFAPDHLHVLYLCKKADPDESALPPDAVVVRHFDEIRFVQNAPRYPPSDAV